MTEEKKIEKEAQESLSFGEADMLSGELQPEGEDALVYDESQIQVLEGLEAVRKRPGMYIGSTSERGLHHLVYEIVDNSIDEAMAGRCDRIEVTLLPDGSVSVQDDGHGIPSGIHPKMGIPTLEVVYTVLHAGGKFGGDGYKFSGGLHGVGASVVNALSTWVEIDNCYEGQRYTERFERGAVARPFRCEGETDRHGLYVRFKPFLKRRYSIMRRFSSVCGNRLFSTQESTSRSGTKEKPTRRIGERMCSITREASGPLWSISIRRRDATF